MFAGGECVDVRVGDPASAVVKRAVLQRSLVRSHAAGAGPEVEREVVRAMALLRLHTRSTATALAGLLNAGITPVVPEYGSLECSGDPRRWPRWHSRSPARGPSGTRLVR